MSELKANTDTQEITHPPHPKPISNCRDLEYRHKKSKKIINKNQ